MMKIPHFFGLFSCVVALCFWLGSCTTPPKTILLNVGVGGVFRDVIVKVINLYQQEKPNVVINPIIAGSDILKQRIERGEPFDLFMAASPKSMDALEQQGLILSASRQSFVSTEIALIVPVDSQLAIADFKDLTDERVKTIAMSLEGPGVSTYTKEILTNLKILQAVKRKAVLANVDVREILKAVETKQVDAGITFLSEAKFSDKVKVATIASKNLHRPVVTSFVLLKNSQHLTEAKEFIEFLKSPKAMTVFQQYGFKPPRVAKKSPELPTS